MLVFCDYNQFPQSWPREPPPARWLTLCRSARGGLGGSRLRASPAQITPDIWSRRSLAPGGAPPGRSPRASPAPQVGWRGLDPVQPCLRAPAGHGDRSGCRHVVSASARHWAPELPGRCRGGTCLRVLATQAFSDCSWKV